MARKQVYGRAYPITERDAKAYRRVNRSLKANPIGVTAMSFRTVSLFKSARAVSRGKSRASVSLGRSRLQNGEIQMAGNTHEAGGS
jgi:hypothetical protein